MGSKFRSAVRARDLGKECSVKGSHGTETAAQRLVLGKMRLLLPHCRDRGAHSAVPSLPVPERAHSHTQTRTHDTRMVTHTVTQTCTHDTQTQTYRDTIQSEGNWGASSKVFYFLSFYFIFFSTLSISYCLWKFSHTHTHNQNKVTTT